MGTRAKRKSEQTPDNTRFPSSQYDIQNASTQATQLHALAMPLRSHSASKKRQVKQSPCSWPRGSTTYCSSRQIHCHRVWFRPTQGRNREFETGDRILKVSLMPLLLGWNAVIRPLAFRRAQYRPEVSTWSPPPASTSADNTPLIQRIVDSHICSYSYTPLSPGLLTLVISPQARPLQLDIVTPAIAHSQSTLPASGPTHTQSQDQSAPPLEL